MDLLQALQAMDWGEALAYLLNAVMVAMGGVVLRYVVPWLKHLSQDSWIERAVKAAEQLYPEPGCGAQKKLYVTSSLLDAGVIRAGIWTSKSRIIELCSQDAGIGVAT